MIDIHTFETARESILPLWSQAVQAQHSAPDARAPETFVFLACLFSPIFNSMVSPPLPPDFMNVSALKVPEEQEWTTMATVSDGAVL
jgi:protein SMG6